MMQFPTCFLAPVHRPSLLQAGFNTRSMQCRHTSSCMHTAQRTVPRCVNGESRAVTPLFEIRNVTYRVPYHQDLWLFDDMNFHIDPGEFVIMLGSNGSGKSTAIQLMLGLEKLKKGRFFWNGLPIKPKAMVRQCGIVLQNPDKYFITSRVIDELTVGRECTPDDVRRVLTDVGLTDISLMADPCSLSGGQMRRLAVADQLMKDPVPSLFILDEPLAGVDWAGRRDILNLMKSLKHRFAVLLVSHEPGEVLSFADRVVELRRRKVLQVDQCTVERAVETRRKLKRERRLKAIEEAKAYELGLLERKE